MLAAHPYLRRLRSSRKEVLEVLIACTFSMPLGVANLPAFAGKPQADYTRPSSRWVQILVGGCIVCRLLPPIHTLCIPLPPLASPNQILPITQSLYRLQSDTNYAAPVGAFLCPEIRAFTGFWGEIPSTASKVLSDRKVLFKHKNGR